MSSTPKRASARRTRFAAGAPRSLAKPARPAAEKVRPGRNPAESPIAWLFSRRDGDGNPLISEAEFNAGERLRADFWFAQMSPNVTQCWSQTAATGAGSRAGSPSATCGSCRCFCAGGTITADCRGASGSSPRRWTSRRRR